MALDQKVKEDIANGTVPDLEIAGFAQQRHRMKIDDEVEQTFSMLDESIKETGEALNQYETAKQTIPEPETEPVKNNCQNSLDTVENSLNDLNQKVAELANVVKAPAVIDFADVFKSIESAKESITDLIKSEQSDSIEERLKALESAVETIGNKQDRNDRQITQTLRENANFQIQVRQGMQKDLEELREQQNGEQFTPILKMLSQIYVEYQVILEDTELSDRTKKNMKSLFSDLQDILEEYDAEVIVSEEGSVRKPRASKIIEKIATGEQEKHNTVARSRKPGVVKGKMVLYPEFVDVYVYDETLDIKEELPEKEDCLDRNAEPEEQIIDEEKTTEIDKADELSETENDLSEITDEENHLEGEKA